MAVDVEEHIAELQWLSGIRHPVDIKTPIEVTLDDTHGTKLADLGDVQGILLMSERLVDGLRDAGVDNIDAYDAILLDPKRNKRFKGYFAVQVIGRMSAVDNGASEADDPLGVGHTMVQYRSLVIDEKSALGQKMFRLHESVSTIVVNEEVGQVLSRLHLKCVEIAPLRTTPLPARNKK